MYSQMVSAKKDDYIPKSSGIECLDEYRETMRNLNRLAREAAAYFVDYIAHER